MYQKEIITLLEQLRLKMSETHNKTFILEWSSDWQKVGRINFNDEIELIDKLLLKINS